MRTLSVLCAMLLTTPALAQPPTVDASTVARVREELRSLQVEYGAAIQRRNRAALERLFVPEFVLAHASGFVDDRAEYLDDLLATESPGGPPFPLDPPGQLHVYGDVAILRATVPAPGGRATWGTFIFEKRDGRWQFVQGQGTLLQPERKGGANIATVT